MPHDTHATQRIRLANDKLLPEVIAMIEAGHTVTLPLRGYSMRPFLEDGRDKALLSKPTDVKVGDTVLAETAPGHYVLHRLVGLTAHSATLRGDGNLATERCRPSDIKAKATGFYRKGRGKLDSTDGRKWRAYSYIWTRLLPIRRYLLFIHRHLFA